MSEHSSPVEHSASDVAGAPRRELTLRQKLLTAALLGAVALGVIWFNALVKRHVPQPDPKNPATTGVSQKFTPPPVIPAKAEATGLPLPTDSPPNTAFVPKEAAAPPIFAYSSGGTSGARPFPLRAANADPDMDSGTAATPSTATTDFSSLARKLKPTVLAGAIASVIKNPNMVITEGTVLPCILQTAINTQLAGFVTCVIPVDVRGTNGNVVLLDRGTKIVGQIESGLMHGQDRVFVLWTRAETPEHVIISLNAPGADELGRAGVPGAVNNHWWDRFGGALMLTLVQGSLSSGTALAAGSGGNGAALGSIYGAQNTGGQVANTALENSIAIPPTLEKNQGDTVSVFVVQDLDFSSVYGLKLTGDAHVP